MTRRADSIPFYVARQTFDDRYVADVAGSVVEELASLNLSRRTKPGQSVAVAVASRGTHDLPELVISVVAVLKQHGLRPFIVPAMGSHGGGTAEGQARVLRTLGISEQTTGVPIVSSMEVTDLGRVTLSGQRDGHGTGPIVYFSTDALHADHIVVINRVKPHTLFRSDVESGLCKMLAVGCGKQRGAAAMHRFDLASAIVPAARRILERAPILFGVTVTETASGHTHELRAVPADMFIETDRELLKSAYSLLPRIPTDSLDLLIVDEMGKNISGPGMDTNVIGFWRRDGGQRDPDYAYLVVLDLTRESEGNATGIGMADITTRRVYNQIDWKATTLNAITAGTPRNGACPIVAENDQAAIEMVLSMLPDTGDHRIVRVRNTLDLSVLLASRAVADELRSRPGVSVDSEPAFLDFDDTGRITQAV